jgi:hypothetical protein
VTTSTAPTSATTATALLRDLLVTTCVRLDRDALPAETTRDPLGDALVALLLDDTGPASTLVAACLYAVHLHPGMGDYLAAAIDRVASAAVDKERGYRVEDDGTHDNRCSWEVGCDECTAFYDDHLDDAVRELLYLLGDRATATLVSVAGVGRGVA